MNTVNTHSKAAGETRTVIVGFGEKLYGTELLTGTPTVDELETSDLTLGTPSLLIIDCEVAGRIIKAYQGVQFSVSGGDPGEDYRIRVTATTDTSPIQTVSANIGLSVYA